MAISSVSNTNKLSSSGPAAAPAVAPSTNRARAGDEQQDAAIVTLSAQARKLSLSQATPAASQTRNTQTQAATRADTAAVAKVEKGASEAAEAPAAQQKENEYKRINTYA